MRHMVKWSHCEAFPFAGGLSLNFQNQGQTYAFHKSTLSIDLSLHLQTTRPGFCVGHHSSVRDSCGLPHQRWRTLEVDRPTVSGLPHQRWRTLKVDRPTSRGPPH